MEIPAVKRPAQGKPKENKMMQNWDLQKLRGKNKFWNIIANLH